MITLIIIATIIAIVVAFVWLQQTPRESHAILQGFLDDTIRDLAERSYQPLDYSAPPIDGGTLVPERLRLEDKRTDSPISKTVLWYPKDILEPRHNKTITYNSIGGARVTQKSEQGFGMGIIGYDIRLNMEQVLEIQTLEQTNERTRWRLDHARR